ncbi:FH1/FH2 domain-containing protein 1 isoform X3 [Diorhabda carinulata]|uniref:FH1/FH2 domain-containing protein 1 isoform X3 n=1 Tax=Diorhabda carinulata TaxID=1163345 RepID=UPI0025A0B9FC|nr:FH1/FH2 domain-containing protein 1 isoform X3 [Diorhabda carinulata]
MSGYRSYSPWNIKTTSGTNYSGKNEIAVGIPKYDSSLGRARSDTKKTEDEKSRIGSRYNSFSTGYRDNIPSTGYSGTTRAKPLLDKKDSSHPPITYRPITRTGSRSRDPSPVEKSEKSSTSSSGYNYNKLYSKPIQRSVSRERTESIGSTSIIPKFVGRTSLTKEESPRYAGRTSVNKEDVSKYSGRSSLSKEEPISSSRYKIGDRTSPREDLSSSGSQKYINSRFLPKNSVEKSYTAYSRPSTTRTNESSRKNRELLNVLHIQQEQERLSRSPSRCSSLTTEDISPKKDIKKEIEMVTITVITRSTSPTQMSQPNNFLRSRRLEIAKTVEKQITRPKKPIHTMVDKEIQSDRLDDSTKMSRFVGASRISSTPWSSFLDMKFSSPNSKPKNSTNDCESPKSLSRESSSKSIQHSCVKHDKSKESKSSKSKLPFKQKQLPPQIPKSENSSKTNSLHSSNPANKDFRKSVLNMNPEGRSNKKIGRRSHSASSADSDVADPDATDVSENLATCKSYHSKISEGKSNRRSPSSEASVSATTSGSEEDIKSKKDNKKLRSGGSSRTSVNVSSADELSSDKSPKPPQSPRIKDTKNEAEAKSFLMRALAPVTSLFKTKQTGSPEKIVCPVEEDNNENQINTNVTKLPAKIIIHRVESGELPWWLQETNEATKSEQKQSEESNNTKKLISIEHVESGELPWWLDENGEIPEGIETYPNWVQEDGTTQDGRVIYKKRNNESDESSWWLTSTEKTDSNKNNPLDSEYLDQHKLRHIDSGERAWWLNSSENVSELVEGVQKDESKYAVRHRDTEETPWWLDDQDQSNEPPLGDRASPEGLEMPKDSEGRQSPYDNVPGSYTKIEIPRLFISKHTNIDEVLGGSTQVWNPYLDKIYGYGNDAETTRAEGCFLGKQTVGNVQTGKIEYEQSQQVKLDDAALQLYKDGDYGSYLDLEASISEQQEEFEGFQSNKKNSIVLRTQLSVRVHTIIEKLLTSEGRELRRALFSLKQIFQEDKDLVHEFVQNDGLSCLIKVGSEADQNYQNYILRALGQVMLYVDGMNGVMEHNQTIQWLYSLISSKFRLVVKTALKLLLVFVEYTESNCMLLIKAIRSVDYSQGVFPYHNIMKLLKDFESADTELLIYAMTLINKILGGVPDQDTYYDQSDALEEQDLESVIQRYMSKPGTDLDLLQQFQIYEAVLQYEDGDETTTPIRHLDESLRKTIRNRKSVVESAERRKSRRHSTGNTPGMIRNNLILQTNREDEDDESSSSQSSGINNTQLNGSYKDNNKGNYQFQQRISNGTSIMRNSSRKDLTPLMNAVNKLDSDEKQPWIYSVIQNQEKLDEIENGNDNERNVLLQLKRENTVKDITQKLANQNILNSPSEEKINRIGDMSGLISKAKEGLAKSKSKIEIIKSPTNENLAKTEAKKSENELRWEELTASLNRSLNLCDMDFTDLGSDDEVDILAPVTVSNGIPPPPPPLKDICTAPPPPPRVAPLAPAPPTFNLQRTCKTAETKIPIKKNKKTVKLFWKEVRDDPITHLKLKTGFIWDELSPVNVDTQKLEHLFESRAKDLITKKQQEMNKNKEIIVLDPKRSNAINIGMTKLPPPRSIKTAILKMDATIMNREGIEKLLTMLPTEEERTKIQEAQAANPEIPLGSAEQFLLTLASISELPARLKLWAFKLDFENSEREIAEPLMDLKQGFEVLKVNKTFRGILSTLLSVGNFLNGNEVKGFQIEYLAKVPEVKDTVHKHSLLHHLCHIVMEKFPDATDLYSEIGAITRASKIDFDELALNIQRLESDCKASWDHLKLIAKHDGSTMMKVKMSDFLSDCAERIILLGIVHRRIINRFHKFLLWLGIPIHQISDTKPNEFCRIVSEFALEYRTTRERVLQQLEKKANHRERNKTRGKMITDVGKFRSKEDRADAELRQLLGSDMSDVESLQGTLPWRRTRKDGNRSFLSPGNGNLTDGDDELIETLVKTATKAPSTRTAPRERKRTRHADRKSLRRTLKNGLSEEEKNHLSAFIKGY